MNREIKFRAWVERYDDAPKMINWSTSMFSDMSSVTGWSDEFPDHEDPDTILMQFTGVQDSDGTDVYDGDVIEMDFQVNSIVRWNVRYDGWTLMTRDTALECRGLLPALKGKVIGNVYENPELGFG